MKKSVLVIDDDVDMCALLSRFLAKNGYMVDTAYNSTKGIEKYKTGKFDAVICDLRLGEKKDGKDVLIELKQFDPNAIVLIITGYSDIKVAVDIIKAGAFDYITKPLVPDEVLTVLSLSFMNASAEATYEPAEFVNPAKKYIEPETGFLTGNSPTSRELYTQVEIVAPTNYSVILNGESGTGKEVIARTIHALSHRKDKPFIAMDCGTLSRELSGSELFGHVKGAFTGATSDKAGHFELANGGTLFLDEVSNLTADIQALLLRVIQERKFKRVGGTREIEVDVRIIVATNENLQEAYRKGKFREDLYHRFNEFSIYIPPLRKRKEDINLFAHFFLQKTNKELDKNIEGFDQDVLKMFVHYKWPGNLREFRNVIRKCVLLTDGSIISAATLPTEITGETVDPAIVAHRTKKPEEKETSSKAEYDAIMQVLKDVNFNKTKAAEYLKIDRKTLYKKIKNYEEPI